MLKLKLNPLLSERQVIFERMAMADVARIAENIREGKDPAVFRKPEKKPACKEPCISSSSSAIAKDFAYEKQHIHDQSSSSYFMADDHSQFSREIEHWMNGSQPVPAGSDGTGPNRVLLVQRSVPAARTSSFENTGIWYLLAMVLPLFSLNSCCSNWSCTSSLVLNTVDLMMTQFARICGRVKESLRHLTQEQVVREFFATVIDILLVIYAVGFLVLSMYQATLFA